MQNLAPDLSNFGWSATEEKYSSTKDSLLGKVTKAEGESRADDRTLTWIVVLNYSKEITPLFKFTRRYYVTWVKIKSENGD